jgi:branched-chain amino acid transport system ATP-binding protein
MPRANLLHAKEVGMQFGGLKALQGFNLEIGAQELVGLIGPNGAGKTTAFNILSGVYQPTTGEIQFEGTSLRGLRPYQVNKLGIARTFQNIRLFSNLTVLENVFIASNRFYKYRQIAAILRTQKFYSEEQAQVDKAKKLLDIFGLIPDMHSEAKNLPYGKQRRLEIVRAMATQPKLLLLDEPAAGMNPAETKELMGLIAQVRKDFGVGILLIEHDMKLVMGICERIFVLDYGVVIAHGKPEEIRKNQKVIEAYLGVAETVNS